MAIYLQHYASVEARIPQYVVCEHCGCDFVYVLKRTGTGESASGLVLGKGIAEQAAAKQARKNLEDQLNDTCDPVPCPRCLRYQDHMHWAACSEKYRWLEYLVTCPMALALIAWVILGVGWFLSRREADHWMEFYTVTAIVAAGLTALGVLLYLLMRLIFTRYDPNTSSEIQRNRVAAKRAMTVDQFYDMHTARTKADYLKYLNGADSESGESAERSDFLIEVWLMPSQLLTETSLAIVLPDGSVAQLVLSPDVEDGDCYQLYSASGERLPFVARVSRFWCRAKPTPNSTT